MNFHQSEHNSVVIIGAGISGLCVAHWLKQKGINVTVLEKDSEPGGTMKTVLDDGWLIETGPNSALETTPLFSQLFDELGIAGKRLYANPASSKRYIVKRGKLLPLPTNAGTFLTSSLWSIGGKLRLLKEPFTGRARAEESVADFVRRRLGREILDYAINPFVAGVHAGNPDELSVQAAFPKLYALEEKYGGLIKGAIKSRKERKQRNEVAKDRAKLFSFADGMQTLPRTLATSLGNSIKLDATVSHIVPMRAGKFPIYTVSYSQSGMDLTMEANAVVLSTPAYATSQIIQRIDPAMAKTLDSIYYPPVAEIFLGFEEDQVGRPLDGFGFLVPEVERRRILGTIWSSTLFPNRAPEGLVALTSFVGGARQPELLALDDEQLLDMVLSELHSLMGVTGLPAYTRITRWDRAIPQYNLGYHNTLNALDRFEQNFQGAFICSNYRGGIAVGDCVMSAEKTIERVIAHLSLI
ncbi:MAG: protoporphyrinogen oxidase [Ignavibacteriae bacterium]|nr:protoporphyrinogen oxidase [Ignavibacteria bacterium]MBI3363943.1 protoporphyrinogen oxidase [Ignavibacteriota bacterium]